LFASGLVWAGPYDETLTAQAARLRAHGAEPGAVAAVAALAGLDEMVAPRALEEAVRGGLGPGVHPLVAAQAAWLAGRFAEQRGDETAAAALRTGLGLVDHAWVIGPFGDGRASFATAFPPEREAAAPERDQRYAGKRRDLGWRSAEGGFRDGALVLDALLRPNDQAVAYVVTFARSDRERTAALRLGSPGPVKVWLNGALVMSRDVVRPAALDQDAAAVRLVRGWNRIVIKTVVSEGPWRIFARLTDAAGAPLPGVERWNGTEWPKLSASRVAAEGRRAGGARPETLEGVLSRRAAEARGDAAARAWLDLAQYLAWGGPRDRDEHAAAAAFDRSLMVRPSLEALLGAADVAPEEDARRRYLLRAAELPGVSPGSRALLITRAGELARALRRDVRASAAWRQALAADPNCWPAVLALAEEQLEAGLPIAALGRVAALPAAVAALPRVRRLAARLADAAGRRAEAERQLRALADERRADVDLLHQLSAWARARGDAGEARARLASAAALRPDLPSLTIELARLDEGAGDGARALAGLSALAARLPDDPATLTALGKLQHRQGRTAEATATLRTSLVLRPQDPDLKRYVERMAAGNHNDSLAADELVRRYAEDARALVPPAGRREATGETAVVLLDRRVVRVHRNGLSRTFAQRVVEIRTERGAEENKEFAVHYTPGTEEVDIRQARIYRRDSGGEVQMLEASDRGDQDLSEPWYGLYYDNRAELVRFDGVRPGDVLEIQYLVDDVASENQLADYFGDLQIVAETIPKRRWEYTLIAPVSRAMHTNTPRVPGLERRESVDGDERITSFVARNVAKVDAEPAMPGIAEVAPYLHVSTYASWQDVGTWYWHLVEDQLTPDDELRRVARSLARGNAPEIERVRAAYDYVVRNTRYVGLEFGIHGYKPYRVTQVMARRFGDCKDKASLLVALLRELGVDAELVLLRTRRGGRLESEPASLAVFDHAVVYVPKLDRYLDGTAEFGGVGELPAQDQGVAVLRVGPHGSVFTETPVLPSSENRVERRWRIRLEASGDGRVEEQLTIRGQAAPAWREHYQTPGERAERYGRVWTGRFPGARLASVDMPEIADRNAPVDVRATVSVPRLAKPGAAGALELPVTGRDADFVRTYARLSERRQDLLLAYPWRHEEELVFELPAGVVPAARMPTPRTVESPFGRFELRVTLEGNVVRVRSSLDVARARVSPGDYARFRAFLGEVDAALDQRVTVVPKAAGAGAEG